MRCARGTCPHRWQAMVITAADVITVAGRRIAVTTDVTYSGSTVGATHESGELSPGYNGQHSVWYSWSPGATGTYYVSTAGSNFDTMLGFYSNTNGLLSGAVQVRLVFHYAVDVQSVPQASDHRHPATVGGGFVVQITTDDDCFGVLTSCVTVSVMVGHSYAIQVDGYNGNWGELELRVSETVPVNDNFAK